MTNPKPVVLIVSSVISGPAVMGLQYYEALKQKGIEVDFLTKYPEPNYPDLLWVVKKNSVKDYLIRLINRMRWLIVGGKPKEKEHYFFYTYEKWPPVPSRLVLKAIKKKYDLVFILFWQGLLSFDTVEKIFDKLHCQIQIGGVDYSQMSGGCHFTRDCQNYKTGCGSCPAFRFNWKNDFTAWNVRFRKRVYEKVKPIVAGNLYMYQFYKESYLLKDARVEIGGIPIIDTDVFQPKDKIALREKYNFPKEKRYIIFFGCQNLNDERKGMRYLFEAFGALRQKMRTDFARVLVISAGKNFESIKNKIPFDSIGFGYVDLNVLSDLYSLATCFVCPSIDDAGPMMVNQSLCCGTPVVGFDMGAVKQVVKNQGTGICVPLKDSEALAGGMYKILTMSQDDYCDMSCRARQVALDTSSFNAQADLILSTYEKYACL